MARHDERKRVLPERLSDGAGLAGCAKARGDVAVRQGGAGRNGARDLVDPTIERRHASHVERDGGKVDRLTLEQLHDALDRALHGGRRWRLGRGRKAPAHARPRPGLGRLRQLDADQPALAPRDPTSADRRIEQSKPTRRHDPPTLARAAPAHLDNLGRQPGQHEATPRLATSKPLTV